MNEVKEEKKEKKLSYIATPTNLFACLDLNCRSLLSTLIQISSMYADEQGWFFRSNGDLVEESKLSKQVLNGALDALLNAGVIDFIPQQQGKGVRQTSRLYKVNFDRFIEFQDISIEERYKNPKYQIETSDYKNGTFTWQGTEWVGKQASSSITSPKTTYEPQSKVTTSIDNIA